MPTCLRSELPCTVSWARFVFYAERTGVLVDHIPAPGEENPDFEEMKRYKK